MKYFNNKILTNCSVPIYLALLIITISFCKRGDGNTRENKSGVIIHKSSVFMYSDSTLRNPTFEGFFKMLYNDSSVIQEITLIRFHTDENNMKTI